VDVPVAQRIARPAWLNARTVLGLLLFGLAFFGGEELLGDARATVAVWISARDLAQDTRIESGDVQLAQVRMSSGLLARYATSADDIQGSVITRSVGAGELISLNSLASASSLTEGRSITIPVSPEHAAGGDLRPGDRIDVFATFDAGDIRSRTALLARAVGVQDIMRAAGLALEEKSLIGVTVAATPEEAARIAFAVRNADIDVVRITGPVTADPVSTVRSSDFR
jgi:Flp pilus assembly protein CpaB